MSVHEQVEARPKRHKRGRRVLSLALCAAALGAACAYPASAAQATTPEGAPVPKLDWRACDDGFQCATAEVPRDYARPNGAKVSLAVIRRTAVDQANRIGSLFLNPGGPGGSAVDFVREAPPVAFQLVSKFDVVGFDPRGVGASRPAVDCDEELDPPAPMTPDTFDRNALLDRARTLARLCDNRDRAFLASLTTANAARDLDVMRAALGDRKLSYLGFSWGGMLGATYASLFPGRARTLVLDSPADGDVWLNRPFKASREQLVGFEASLDRFLAACAAAREACGFGGKQPEDALDELIARLDESPLDVGDGRAIDGHDLREIILESLYRKQNWGPLAAALVAAEKGDGGALRDLADVVMGPGHELLYDAFNSYISVERRYPRQLTRYLESAEHDFAVSPHFAFGSYETASELFWPVEPRGAFYGPYRHAERATPALVFHTTHDPATPYAWGKRVVRDLGNARLVTYRGDGHGVITDLNPCVAAALVPYLEDGVLPPPGTTCNQGLDPFEARAAIARRGSHWRAR
jgi:pimeloyl-ACP methyl ester carboxylesterase